ncbi:MAG: nucleotidyltransferase domain-containing protein [Desulfobacteraceae bacterium]|jgi:predicted nucleotidyltransferase|nr:nucleotidyltransferase domain-containing protein [Desulfobacteraceae bacterium]
MNTKNIITNNCITEFLVILKEYFYKNDEIIAAYLFGSFAAGKATPSSDLDIALLIPPAENRMEVFHARLRYHTELSDLMKKNVDIVLLREAGEMLSYQILKFGRLVFERDRDSHREFVAKRVIQCLDFKYYEKIMQQGMINAMRREYHG